MHEQDIGLEAKRPAQIADGEAVEALGVGAGKEDGEPPDDGGYDPGDADEEQDYELGDGQNEPQPDSQTVAGLRKLTRTKGHRVRAVPEWWIFVTQEDYVGDGFAAPCQVEACEVPKTPRLLAGEDDGDYTAVGFNDGLLAEITLLDVKYQELADMDAMDTTVHAIETSVKASISEAKRVIKNISNIEKSD